MRKVIINGEPPIQWIEQANEINELLVNANSIEERNDIIDKYDRFWGRGDIKAWLIQQFDNKCWYTESVEAVGSYHVDHYRPKGSVRDQENNHTEGYWWLAFNWKNYILSGQLINVKKRDLFPILGTRAKKSCTDDELCLESPLIINPTTDQAYLISFQIDEGGCFAVEAEGIDENENQIAVNTISILGLNRLPILNDSRRKTWDQCIELINRYKTPVNRYPALALVEKTQHVIALTEKIQYGAEYSSVAISCIRKNAPESLVTAVFANNP